jgi:prevent-host-death family protein
MFVNSTELQNNFGKYLMLAGREEIIITRNGTPVAKLVALQNMEEDGGRRSPADSAAGKAERKPGNRPEAAAAKEALLALKQNTGERYEYIDGQRFVLPAPGMAHQYALTKLCAQFCAWFEGKTFRPIVAPYDIALTREADNSVHLVQPDLMVICDPDKLPDEKESFKGLPSLVVEILGENTRRKDLVHKLHLYMTCGVPEYWVVNPLNREITVYAFRDGDIAENATFREGEKAISYVFPGLHVDVGRLFQ